MGKKHRRPSSSSSDGSSEPEPEPTPTTKRSKLDTIFTESLARRETAKGLVGRTKSTKSTKLKAKKGKSRASTASAVHGEDLFRAAEIVILPCGVKLSQDGELEIRDGHVKSTDVYKLKHYRLAVGFSEGFSVTRTATPEDVAAAINDHFPEFIAHMARVGAKKNPLSDFPFQPEVLPPWLLCMKDQRRVRLVPHLYAPSGEDIIKISRNKGNHGWRENVIYLVSSRSIDLKKLQKVIVESESKVPANGSSPGDGPEATSDTPAGPSTESTPLVITDSEDSEDMGSQEDSEFGSDGPVAGPSSRPMTRSVAAATKAGCTMDDDDVLEAVVIPSSDDLLNPEVVDAYAKHCGQGFRL